ncbi:MAG: F0F1 ATP synthase subunit gamma [Pseudomonadota bacterium]
MTTLESLADQIETTEDVRSIVRTMKSLSVVSIRQYEREARLLREYRETVERGLQAALSGALDRPLSTAADGPSTGRRALLVFGSDRGLCGRFNDIVADRAVTLLAASSTTDDPSAPLVLAVGARAAARLQTLGYPPSATLNVPGAAAGIARLAQTILITLDNWRERHDVERIEVFYNIRAEQTRTVAEHRVLAPLPPEMLADIAKRPWPSPRLPMVEGARPKVLSALLRQHLFATLCATAAESLASENAARLSAMLAAERGIDDRLDALGNAFRSTRQDEITNELIDLVTGFEAARG